MFRTVKTILVVLAVLISSIASADLAIIAHPDYDAGELNEDIVRKLFLRENTAFPSGHTAIPANQAIGSRFVKTSLNTLCKWERSGTNVTGRVKYQLARKVPLKNSVILAMY